jgi:hypothetical protein
LARRLPIVLSLVATRPSGRGDGGSGPGRALRRAPAGAHAGFTLVALITLALGIGANTAIFSVVHGVLLRPLPFQDPDRLFVLWARHTSTDRYPLQLPEFCDYRDQNRTLESIAAFGNWNPNITGDGRRSG